MKCSLFQPVKLCLLSLLLLQGTAAVAVPTSADYALTPPILSRSQTPLLMLAMSNDHQLFFKAYSDYDDLDGDGIADLTYKHSFDYYGYFDSTKCYTYQSITIGASAYSAFVPTSNAADKYCGGTSDEWSGNFLNWATMTRIDSIRKLLYGGMRVADTADQTILERAFLPNDAHSFAKFYQGSDLRKLTPFAVSEGVTMCNTTVAASSAVSHTTTEPPLLRVAKGDYSLWAANERWQCRWSGEKSASNSNVPANSGLAAASKNPSKAAAGLGEIDYHVRLQVCRSGMLEGNCIEYGSGARKPTGVLQTYGDQDLVHFGLMTGTYGKNKSGGVLRKEIQSFQNEVDQNTGIFKPTPAGGGIVNTLNRLRLYGYEYNAGGYNNLDKCDFQRNGFPNGECTNWGNPVSEILTECYRYFAGRQPNPAFDTDDTAFIPGLTRDTGWTDPLTSTNKCANLSVLMFNASTVSYDGDELGRYESDFGVNLENLTKTIGDREGITGKSFFVGENGTDNNQLCTPKVVNNLGKVEGTCPDAPRLDGSYKMAGAAFHARTSDLRTDLEGKQTVETYGVALSPGVPTIRIPVPKSDGTLSERFVTLLPACRNEKNKPTGNCAIVDFKIVQPFQNKFGSPGTFFGKLYVNWEDSEQGGDFDQDMWGTIDYEINATTIKVTTDVHAESTSGNMGFGYVIGGTTADGFHVHSGIEGYTRADPTGLTGCNNCQKNDAATSNTYTIGTSVAELLRPPLYYAAKWGGFTDQDNDQNINQTADWDAKDNRSGALIPDGLPDNYFLATNPAQLEAQLETVLKNIVSRSASGTNAAVVSNNSSGVGALYQALYQPSLTEGANTVTWVGKLHSLFVDNNGNLREDGDGDGVLDDGTIDPIVKIQFSVAENTTVFYRYGDSLENVPTQHNLPELRTLWSAERRLAELTNLTSNRSYDGNASTGRYIFTATHEDADGLIDADDVIPFESAQFAGAAPNNRNGYLGVDTANVAKLVNYIRGEEQTGFRSRTIDMDGDGSTEVWRLGDIVHSTPAVVGTPRDAYDRKNGDSSYTDYRDKYRNRREMIYSGANDGMLHAFNGGFWDPVELAFNTDDGESTTNETAHPLGAELWAYVPTNLLPHLRWLPESKYPHVYYVDGEPQAFDVNIFPDDSVHPKGWGTILVATMRFGGGDINVDVDANKDGTPESVTMRSALVVFDITDPEQPPVLLGEFTDAQLGFTTSKPTLVRRRVPATGDNWTTPAENDWYLAFGSGPHGSQALSRAESDQPPRFWMLNLKTLYANASSPSANDPYLADYRARAVGTANGYLGDFASIDWDRDYADDAVYFGSVIGDLNSSTGAVHRVNLAATFAGTTTNAVKAFVDVGKPVVAAPLPKFGTGGQRWVQFGTGRHFVTPDNLTTTQQYFFGVKDPVDSSGQLTFATVNASQIVNTSHIVVFNDGSIKRDAGSSLVPVTIGSGPILANYDDLKTAMRSQPGWSVKMAKSGTLPSGRVTGTAVSIFDLVLFAEYVPPQEPCDINGESFLWALGLETGTATPYLALQDAEDYVNATEPVRSLPKVTLGEGQTGTASLHQGSDGVLKAITNMSTGEIGSVTVNYDLPQSGRQSWRQINLDNL